VYIGQVVGLPGKEHEVAGVHEQGQLEIVVTHPALTTYIYFLVIFNPFIYVKNTRRSVPMPMSLEDRGRRLY
jgi:hypothetical protein